VLPGKSVQCGDPNNGGNAGFFSSLRSPIMSLLVWQVLNWKRNRRRRPECGAVKANSRGWQSTGLAVQKGDLS
jgi:hypothetical protein